MPELPEVETICRNLKYGAPGTPSLLDWRVKNVQVFWERTLQTPLAAEFVARLPGQAIRQIDRRGKYLIFWLTDDYLLIHLRMSGDLIVEKDDTPQAKHHRMTIRFENGYRLAFNDPRKFGRVWLVGDPQEILGRLGPEPLDESFTVQSFYHSLLKTRRQLKPLLLDQSFLAGMGNIYTDEALHMAGLHPRMQSNLIDLSQAERLWESIRSTLQEGILRNGASIDWVYRGGDFQNFFRVYQRTGQPCVVCGALIERIVVGQRGTHICPSCQPAQV